MLRFDDQFPLHRKVDGLTDSAFRLHVEAIFWCARNLTDGFIAQDDLGSVSRFRKPEGYLAECVKRGAWHRVEDGRVDCQQCASRYGNTLNADGWLIHGYLDWQLARTKALKIRADRQKAGSIGGKRSGKTRASKSASRKNGVLLHDNSPPKPQPTPPGEANSEANAKQEGLKQTRTPIPSPSKEGNRGERAAPLGAPLAPADAPPPAPPINGRPTTPPPTAKALLEEARAKAAAASRKAKAAGESRHRGALEELLAIPTPQPAAPSDEGPSDPETPEP